MGGRDTRRRVAHHISLVGFRHPGFYRAAPQFAPSKSFVLTVLDAHNISRSRRLTQAVSRRLPGKEVMSSGSGLGSVHTLVSLPSPLDSAKGRINAEPVCSLVGDSLRKRQEIVVSIDGECVNIYDVSFLTLG